MVKLIRKHLLLEYGNLLPGKLTGAEEIKKKLFNAIEQIRPYYKQYEDVKK
jgi:hypothetical protein